MPVNIDKPHRWKQDVAESVDVYNQWFLTSSDKTCPASKRSSYRCDIAVILSDLTA